MKYQVILADPPWFYNNRNTGGERKNPPKFGGGCRKHYPVMKDSELLDMRGLVDTLADDNCALFVWATYPRLDFGIELVKGWGFRYATVAFTWIKYRQDFIQPVYGPGYYTASNPEIVLLGIRGSMPPVKKMVESVIRHPRMDHSRKPEIHRQIDEMYPEANKIEFFARREYPGWKCLGNQLNGEELA